MKRRTPAELHVRGRPIPTLCACRSSLRLPRLHRLHGHGRLIRWRRSQCLVVRPEPERVCRRCNLRFVRWRETTQPGRESRKGFLSVHPRGKVRNLPPAEEQSLRHVLEFPRHLRQVAPVEKCASRCAECGRRAVELRDGEERQSVDACLWCHFGFLSGAHRPLTFHSRRPSQEAAKAPEFRR
jgi:hypothetical protein